MNPAISIVIRSFNSVRTLPALLDRLPLQTGDELILVDSGSTDATLEIARQHNARIIKVDGPFNYSRSLNLGFAATKNPWVLALSSHCLPLNGNLLESFRQAITNFPEAVAVAYGKCSLVVPQDFRPSPVVNQASPPQQRWSVYGGNAVALYRREQWVRRPFDETLPTAEDMAWFTQALTDGASATQVPHAVVLYRNAGNLAYMFRKGWLESRMGIQMAGRPPMNLWALAINYGSLFKKWATAKIPLSVLLRQTAHATGAYLSPKFLPPSPARPSGPSKPTG